MRRNRPTPTKTVSETKIERRKLATRDWAMDAYLIELQAIVDRKQMTITIGDFVTGVSNMDRDVIEYVIRVREINDKKAV